MEPKIIYKGTGLCPALAIQYDKKSGWYGWLFVQHPDGGWVSIAKVLKGDE